LHGFLFRAKATGPDCETAFGSAIRKSPAHDLGPRVRTRPLSRTTMEGPPCRVRPTAGGAVLDLQPGYDCSRTRERLDGVASGVYRWRTPDASGSRQAPGARDRGARGRGAGTWCRFHLGRGRDPAGYETLPRLSTGRASAPCETGIAGPNLRNCPTSRPRGR